MDHRARTSGKLPLLIVQGVLMTDLARAADIVLPGASSIEKDALYVNQQGTFRPPSRALTPPGDAQEDWQIFVNLGDGARRDAGVHEQRARARGRRRGAGRGRRATRTSPSCRSRGRSRRRHWLQASNPSERWKWDVMFQDLPPVKFDGSPEPSSIPGAISLQKID